MGLPEINIIFKTQAKETAKVANRGVIAVILKDSGVDAGAFTCLSADEIPDKLTAANQSYLKSILIGNVTVTIGSGNVLTKKITTPRKLFCYALATDAEDYAAALDHFAALNFDYIVGPPDITSELADAVLEWVGTQRDKHHRKYKCVLPEKAANKIYCVNVDTYINDGSKGAFCGRVAGLICGTPLTQSITYAEIPEAESCPMLDDDALSTAIDAGKIVLINDTEKIKIARGVNSLTELDETHNTDQWKNIQIVETMDLIQDDLRKLYADYYIGKYKNNYDNKMLLVSATQSYFDELVLAEYIEDAYECELDVEVRPSRKNRHKKASKNGMNRRISFIIECYRKRPHLFHGLLDNEPLPM